MQTIRLGYLEIDDRALVEFISDERRVPFLFTRRMMRRVINGIAQLLAKSSRAMARAPVDVKTEVLIFEHQSAVQSADGADPAAAARPTGQPGTTTPGAAAGAALLAKIDIQTEQRSFKLTFIGHEGTGHEATVQTLDLSRAEMHRLLASLHKLAYSAGWNLENEVGWLKEADAPFAPSTRASS